MCSDVPCAVKRVALPDFIHAEDADVLLNLSVQRSVDGPSVLV
jgi:hypothetical protein